MQLIKLRVFLGLTLGLTLMSFQSAAQVFEDDSTEVDSGLVYDLPIDKSVNIYSRLWDTSKIGIIPLPAGDRATLCIHLTDDIHCCFVAPCRGVVTSNFGWRHGRIHAGIDIDLETGDPVSAAFDGMVRQAGWNRGYGYFVIISHFNGLETLYGHLSHLKTEAFQPVKSGQIIGLGGNTGHSRGSHLHFEIRYFGKPLNPKLLINFDEYTLHTDSLMVGYASTFSKSNYINELGNMMEVANDSVYRKREAIYEAKRQKDLIEKQKRERERKNQLKKKKSKKSKADEAKRLAKATHHTVVRGDTLYSISKKYKTSVAKLCALNGLKETDILSLGRKLKVK